MLQLIPTHSNTVFKLEVRSHQRFLLKKKISTKQGSNRARHLGRLLLVVAEMTFRPKRYKLKCDQMAKLFVQYLAVHSRKNAQVGSKCSQSRIKIRPKEDQNIAKHAKIFAQRLFTLYAKGAIFRQIWSHC